MKEGRSAPLQTLLSYSPQKHTTLPLSLHGLGTVNGDIKSYRIYKKEFLFNSLTLRNITSKFIIPQIISFNLVDYNF
jgi:hypothetical protein